jgi:hypothetical protein
MLRYGKERLPNGFVAQAGFCSWSQAEALDLWSRVDADDPKDDER